jgi:hypothetical protein
MAVENTARRHSPPSLMVWWPDVEGGHQGRIYLWLRIPRPGVPCNDSGVSRDVAGKRS